MTSERVIPTLLQRRYGFAQEQDRPGWADAFSLPELEPVTDRIASLTSQLDDVRSELRSAQELADSVGRFRKLLYETGTEALEPVGRDALAALGGSVELAEDPGVEDARVTDPSGRHFVVEIKGRTGSLKIADARQLQDWVTRAIAHAPASWEGTGLLIVNAFADLPPSERKDPFPAPTKAFASRFGLTYMTTTQLFRALADSQRGDLKPAEFWDALVGVGGSCELPELVESQVEPLSGAE
jgi:hypothetical protein